MTIIPMLAGAVASKVLNNASQREAQRRQNMQNIFSDLQDNVGSFADDGKSGYDGASDTVHKIDTKPINWNTL